MKKLQSIHYFDKGQTKRSHYLKVKTKSAWFKMIKFIEKASNSIKKSEFNCFVYLIKKF